MKRPKSLILMMMTSIAAVALAALALALALMLLASILINAGWLLPANTGERFLSRQEQILNADFRTENIAFFYDYALFDESGHLLEGNMEGRMLETARTRAQTGPKEARGTDPYRVLAQPGQVLVLRYHLNPLYGKEAWNDLLPSWDTVLLALWFALLVFFCVAVTRRFVKRVNRSLTPILDFTAKIAGQDLDFDIGKSDIKELNRVNEALARMKDELQLSLERQWQAEAKKNRQMAAIAHDIKTPLTIILSRAQLLAERTEDEKSKDSLLRIEASAEQIEALVEHLMGTSLDKPMEMKRQDENLSVFFERIASIGTSLAMAKGQSFHAHASFSDETANFDASLMERALMNVLDNAAAYAPEGATLFLAGSINREDVVVDIANTGSWFSDEDMHLGCELFYRGAKERRADKHYGLGLYNAREIIKNHGGTITLENKDQCAHVRIAWPRDGYALVF